MSTRHSDVSEDPMIRDQASTMGSDTRYCLAVGCYVRIPQALVFCKRCEARRRLQRRIAPARVARTKGHFR
jgi:hypothetical protein